MWFVKQIKRQGETLYQGEFVKFGRVVAYSRHYKTARGAEMFAQNNMKLRTKGLTKGQIYRFNTILRLADRLTISLEAATTAYYGWSKRMVDAILN